MFIKFVILRVHTQIEYNIAIKRSSVLRQPTKPNLDGEVCKTSEPLNSCYNPR